jgi:hypothetical protein
MGGGRLSDNVRRALRERLLALGHVAGADTVGLRGELYVRGDGDRAAAMFEFQATAEEAFVAMYQGRWLPSMPPRFAVLPASEKEDPALDMLRQVGLSVLLYERDGEGVVFVDLDDALEEIARRNATDML